MFGLGHALENYIVRSIAGSMLGSILTFFIARPSLNLQWLPRNEFRDLMRLSLPYIPTYLSNSLLQFVSRFIDHWILRSGGSRLVGSRNQNRPGGNVQIADIFEWISSIITVNYDNESGQSLRRKIGIVYEASAEANFGAVTAHFVFYRDTLLFATEKEVLQVNRSSFG